jgi:hypothetical protein
MEVLPLSIQSVVKILYNNFKQPQIIQCVHIGERVRMMIENSLSTNKMIIMKIVFRERIV